MSKVAKFAGLSLALIGAAIAPVGLAQSASAVPAYKLDRVPISETLTIERKNIAVNGSTMSYLEAGSGEPVLFIHGNPSSAYLWRNVIPYVSGDHRAIAVDLIGMGSSGKPDIAYSFDDHYRYLESFIDALGLDHVTLVGHDWGAALAWEYARRHPEKVVRIAFMEGVLPPAFPQPSFDAMGERGAMFRAFKDEKMGPKMLIDDNMFIEQILPAFINRPLGDEARKAYRAPFLNAKDRRPILAWTREVPIQGTPASSVALMQKISSFMGSTKMPVLLAYADPGALTPPEAVPWFRGKIRHLETAYVGQGLHFIQEDQPDAIGRALADWLRRN